MAPISIVRLSSWLTVITSAVNGAPLGIEPRAVIAHNAVVGFPQTVPADTTGQLYLKYKPYLKVFNGCVPFPAVEADGDTKYFTQSNHVWLQGLTSRFSGGLATTGDPSGQCSSSTGQVYVRGATYGSSYAIMYAWYMPKDSPSSGLGHRHEWENIVVWLSGASTSATLRGVAVSQHGDYEKSTTPNLSGTSPLVGYISYWPVNHQLIFTDSRGGQQPLIAWESMTAQARAALSSTDFGDATVPFKDSTFQANLAKAVV
jgi:hypothetical protein